MKQVYLKATSYCLPANNITNEEIVKDFPDWSINKISSKIGISERHIVNNDECASDLAYSAAKRLFEEHAISPNSIDFILFCTQSPDYFLPTTACVLQSKLGIPTSAGALDFNLGCSGFIYGLSLAKGLVCANIAKNVLLLTADSYSKYIHPKDRVNRTIFGDAGTASLVSTDGIAEIKDFSLGTDGSGAENLIVKTGGMRNPHHNNDVRFDEAGNPISSDHLYMNGTEIFNFTLENVPLLVKDTLLKNDLAQADINMFVFHQANKYLLNFLRKKIKIENEKFYYYLDKVLQSHLLFMKPIKKIS